MITNTGKNIVAKYLVGQAPAYASYIALGCGATPLNSDATLGDYSAKKNLDFEMFRVPITSRGYINENGTNKIVLTAELPTEERYAISEVGIYSAGSNPTVGAYGSKIIYSFNDTENWEYHSSTTASSIPTVYTPLDGSNNDSVISVEYPVFQTNADNRVFGNTDRIARNEGCRFLNNVLVMRGDNANLTKNGSNHLVIGNNSNHIHLAGTNVDFNKNTPTDELRFAFSVINKDGTETTNPDEVRILIEFASTDVSGSGESAKFEIILNSVDFSTNRYFVIKKQLQELIKTTGLTWSLVNVVKIYTTVIKNNNPSDQFYVCLDALRLENTSELNTLYGLTGYSVIRNTDAQPILKYANTTNYVEFRFNMDVV